MSVSAPARITDRQLTVQKITGWGLKQTFNKDYLEQHPFYRMNYDHLILKLSKLFDLVRHRGHPVQGDSSAGGSQNAFVRSTTKYWVHDENLVPLKLAIMKHLPVLVFDANKEWQQADSAITSIYFDNEDLELYLGRLEKTEGAEAIRMRWYGDVTGKTVCLLIEMSAVCGIRSLKYEYGLTSRSSSSGRPTEKTGLAKNPSKSASPSRRTR